MISRTTSTRRSSDPSHGLRSGTRPGSNAKSLYPRPFSVVYLRFVLIHGQSHLTRSLGVSKGDGTLPSSQPIHPRRGFQYSSILLHRRRGFYRLLYLLRFILSGLRFAPRCCSPRSGLIHRFPSTVARSQTPSSKPILKPHARKGICCRDVGSRASFIAFRFVSYRLDIRIPVSDIHLDPWATPMQ